MSVRAGGTVAALIGIAASVITGATGVVSQSLGHAIAFLLIAAIAGSAVITSWLFLSEARPRTLRNDLVTNAEPKAPLGRSAGDPLRVDGT
jgi:hypothetical protein